MSQIKNLSKSEIREDKIHDRFVIVAPGRIRRPNDVNGKMSAKGSSRKMSCVFCPEQQKGVKALYQSGDGDKWRVKVVENIFPALTTDNNQAYGRQEVVIETSEHGRELGDLPADHLIEIFEAYIERTKELAHDKRIRYILIFKNKGGEAGASLQHAHSQIFAAGFMPPHIIGKLTRAQEYRVVHGRCYYCDLVREERKSPRLIAENKYAVAITPYASNYEYEAWIIPRKHWDNITLLSREEIAAIVELYKDILQKLSRNNISYNVYLHQSVLYSDEHFYIRICPRRSTWAGVELGSRIIINAVSPEEAAGFYRE